MRVSGMKEVSVASQNLLQELEKSAPEVVSFDVMGRFLRKFNRQLTSKVGEEFFCSLVKHLALVANADHVFICEFCDAGKTRLRTLAFLSDGELQDHLEFDLVGTHCEKVVTGGSYCQVDGVQAKLSAGAFDFNMGAGSYIGIPLTATNGQTLGVMAIMNRTPLSNCPLAELFLQIYALRTAAELERIGTEKIMKDQAHYLQNVLDAIPHPIYFKDLEGRYTGCNKTLEISLGVTKEQMLGKTVFEYAPKRAVNCHNADLAVYHKKAMHTYEDRVDYADGSRRDVIFSKAPIVDRDGTLCGLVGTILDISKCKRADLTFQALINSMVGVDGELSLKKITVELCRWFDANYAFVFKKDHGRKLRILAIHSDRKKIPDCILDRDGTPCGEVIDHGYRCYPQHVQELFPLDPILTKLEAQSYIGAPLYGQNGAILGTLCVLSRRPLNPPEQAREMLELLAVKVASELTFQDAEVKLKKNKTTLDYVANFHQLTGLPNASAFKDHLHNLISCHDAQPHQIAVLQLDLDRLKKINSSLGREAGDQVLQQVGQRLENLVLGVGFVAYLTSDEFGIILDEIADVNTVHSVIDQIQNSLLEPLMVVDCTLYVSASIGISLYPADGDDVNTLLTHADEAVSRAKELGKNTYQFYESAMNKGGRELLLLESHLRNALKQEQFVLHYQPQFDLTSKEIIGAEALVRWEHPGFGTVPPSDFISVAEDTGLILPIGEWVLHTACQQNKKWQESGYYPFPIAVNLSARQFCQSDLVEMVSRTLTTTGLDPKFLELEITESLIMQDVEAAITTMEELNDLGVSLAIDDFGTGYSSLSYLKRFPIAKLKIDRSFVTDVTQNEDDAAIATSIIALSHSMHLRTIAEGIETQEQLLFLQEAGCEEGQGYYFSRPISVEDFCLLLGDDSANNDVTKMT